MDRSIPTRVLRFILLPVVLSLAVGGTAACGNGGPTGVVVGPVQGGEDGGGPPGLEVDVRGDTVTYRWDGGDAHLLQVRNLEEGTTVWRIVAVDRTDAGGFAPPVRHGMPPAEASEEVAPNILVRGDRHRVTVELADGTTGSREFTP